MSARSGDHPQRDELLRLAEGGSVPSAVAAHLERCPGCRSRYEEMAGTIARMRSDRWPEPSPELVRAVERIAARELAEPEVSTVAARPVASGTVIGVRSGSGTAPVLSFAGEGLAVELQVSLAGGRLRIAGQALAEPGASLPAVAWLEVGGEAVTEEAAVGDHGEFLLEHEAVASLAVVLDLGERRLRLGPFAPEA